MVGRDEQCNRWRFKEQDKIVQFLASRNKSKLSIVARDKYRKLQGNKKDIKGKRRGDVEVLQLILVYSRSVTSIKIKNHFVKTVERLYADSYIQNQTHHA